MRVCVWAWVGVWLVLAGAASAGRAYVASRVLEYGFGGAFDEALVEDSVDGAYTMGPLTLNTTRAAKTANTNGVTLSGGGTGDAGVSSGNCSVLSEYIANGGSGFGAFSLEIWILSSDEVSYGAFNQPWVYGTLDASGGPEDANGFDTPERIGLSARDEFLYAHFNDASRQGRYNAGVLSHGVFVFSDFGSGNALRVYYFNGLIDSSGTSGYGIGDDPLVNPAFQFVLGRPNTNELAWFGTIYAAAIYNEELNATQVAALYNEGIINQRPTTTAVHRIVFTDTLTPLSVSCSDSDAQDGVCTLRLATLANHTALFVDSTEETAVTAASGLPYLLPLNQTTVWVRGQAAVSTETSFTFRVQDDGVGELQSALATAYLHVAVILHPRVEDGLLFEYALRDGHRAQDLAFTDVATDSQGNLVGPGSLTLQLSRVAWISNTTGLRVSGADTTLSGSLSSRSVLALLT